MFRTPLFVLYLILFYFKSYSQCDSASVFNNTQTSETCIDSNENVLNIYANNLPDHAYGSWPSNSPVTAKKIIHHVCAYPQKGNTKTSIYKHSDPGRGCSEYIRAGIGLNGVFYSGWGARYFVNPNTQEENTDFNVEATKMFSMGFNNGHSNSDGAYHYHGIPIVYYKDSLKIDGTSHSPLIGYAADGHPMYYKYVYTNPNKPIDGVSAFNSGYVMKIGNRPGDGITAPNGTYDGLYVEDYEFINNTSELDECNGRYGITPEYPNGTYYYVLTDNWPYIPRCFYGTVIDNSFRIGKNCPSSTAEVDCSPEVINNTELSKNIDFNIFPNPTGDYININSDLEIENISIYDNKGIIQLTKNSDFNQLNLTTLKKGTYFIQITTSNTEITRKIIKR